jgi:hypothetical protein
VPVVVVPDLQIYLSGEASAQAWGSASVEQEMNLAFDPRYPKAPVTGAETPTGERRRGRSF